MVGEALKSRRSAISSRFEHASRELARVDQGDGRYADFSDEEKTAVKETLIGMRTDALYALSVFDSGTIKQSPFQGDEDYVNEMMGRASGIREGQPVREDQPQIAADPVQAEYIETMIGSAKQTIFRLALRVTMRPLGTWSHVQKQDANS